VWNILAERSALGCYRILFSVTSPGQKHPYDKRKSLALAKIKTLQERRKKGNKSLQ
jgi:hypothetical protein